MSAENLSRFEDLASRYLDDALTEAEASELVALFADPQLAAWFLEMTRLNSEIAGLLAAPVPDAAMVELVRADIEKGLAAAHARSDVRLCLAEREMARGPSAATVSVGHSSPRQRRPTVRWLARAAVFIVFASLATVFLVSRPRHAGTAVVASVRGDARCAGSRGERVLTTGQSWERGETLNTVGAKSTVAVTFRDGTRLDFSGNSIVVNQSLGGGCRMELEHGEMRATLVKQPARHPFTFATTEAEAIVVSAKLRLAAGAHRTRLEVTEGEVRFRRRHDGAEVIVKAGHFAVVAPNAPFTATPFHPDPLHP